LLLSKPQYYGEVLAPFCTRHEVRLALASPELAAAHAAKGRCEAALTEVKELAFARLGEITALTSRVQAESAALHEAQRLAFERLNEIAALRAQLETVQREMQALEETMAVRILRRAGLLKLRQ